MTEFLLSIIFFLLLSFGEVCVVVVDSFNIIV